MSDGDLLRRVRELEERIGNIELIEYSKVFFKILHDTTSPKAWTTIASRSAADNGLIDLSATFGVPANVQAVILRVDINDVDTGNPVALVSMGTTSTPTEQLMYAGFDGQWMIYNSVIVPCTADGDIYISFDETVSNFRFFVLGWII